MQELKVGEVEKILENKTVVPLIVVVTGRELSFGLVELITRPWDQRLIGIVGIAPGPYPHKRSTLHRGILAHPYPARIPATRHQHTPAVGAVGETVVLALDGVIVLKIAARQRIAAVRTAIVEHYKLSVGGLKKAKRFAKDPSLLERAVELIASRYDVPRVSHERGIGTQWSGCAGHSLYRLRRGFHRGCDGHSAVPSDPLYRLRHLLSA